MSSEWKLPPNIYSYGESLIKTQAGKKGPYKCFTVARESKTIISHFAPKPEKEFCKTDFYEVNQKGSRENSFKYKFSKTKRFKAIKDNVTPPPTKYFPQLSSLKNQKLYLKDKEATPPVFYYQLTTIPSNEFSFNKKHFQTPDPSRYNKSAQKKSNSDKLLSKTEFQSKFQLNPSTHDDKKEMRFNILVSKRNKFGMKTGRPVAFLSATPRFDEIGSEEKSIELYEKPEKYVPSAKGSNKHKKVQKPISQKRLEELATPKNVPSKFKEEKNQVFIKRLSD